MTLTRDEIERDRAAGTPDYDMGLLNDFGGGDVDWWFDYLRAEIARANDYWRDIHLAAEAREAKLRARIAELEAALQRIADAPAWGAPDRWETTPAEIRQFARAALKGRDE